MRILAVLACLLFSSAAYAQLPGFPPGAFLSRGALDPPASAPLGCSTGGPGDCVTGAVAWWGFRGYNSAYSGKAANICLPLDATCVDVSISGGNINVGTITTLGCNNTTTICTVKILYDQSGALACAGSMACDVTNATIGSRPVLTLSALNSIPCATFTNSSSILISTNALTLAQPFTFSSVAERTSNFTSQQDIIGSGSAAIYLGWSNMASTAQLDSGNPIPAAAADSAFHALQGVVNGATPASSITVDGTTTTGSSGSNAFSAASINVGGLFNTAVFGGIACEAGIWPSAFNSTQLSNMNNNQHAYWNF